MLHTPLREGQILTSRIYLVEVYPCLKRKSIKRQIRWRLVAVLKAQDRYGYDS